MADDIYTSLEIIEKLLFPQTDFWRNNYLKVAVTVNKEKISCSNGRCRQQSKASSYSCTQVACSLCTNTTGISKCII